MAISLYTVTGNASDILGINFGARRVKVVVSTNLPRGEAPIDLENNRVLLGGSIVWPSADGSFTIPDLVGFASADVNPTGIQYKIDLVYVDAASRQEGAWSTGWVSITADATISELVEEQYVPPAYLSAAVETLQELVDEASATTGLTGEDEAVAFLVADEGSETASALSASIDANIGRDAADADGTTNDSPAIQTAIDDPTVSKTLLRSVTPDGASTPNYVLRDTVDLPRDRSLSGDGWRTRIVVPADGGDYDGGIIFRLNTDSGGDWEASYPGFPASVLESFQVQALTASAAGHSITVAELGGSQRIEDVFLAGVDQLARQIDEYCDLVEIKRVNVWRKKDTSKYLIELGYTGDGVVVDQIGMSHEPTDTDRPKLIYMRYKNGATLSNLVNGDVYIQDSRGVDVNSLHHESGHVTFDNSSGQLRNAVLYMRGAGAGDMAGVPLTVTCSQSGVTSLRSQQVTLQDVAFAYTMNLLGDYPTDGTANFQITANGGAINRARVSVRNAYRWINSDTNFADSIHTGVTCGVSDFDAYSHLASRESNYELGAWVIDGSLPALQSSDGVDSASATSFRPWSGSTGTFYYKVVNYHDTKRRIGRVGALEQSVALTNGGNGASVVLAAESRCPSMVRVYRGTSTGSYDKYVDVPLMSGGRLHDSGADVAGFPWIARSAGVVDSVNSTLDAGLQLRPGETGAGSDAYGEATVFARSLTSAPTLGSWRRGDMVRGPMTSEKQIAWFRATDCTTGSPAHVVGTDWIAVYATSPGIIRGTGSPNGVVTAPLGWLYIREDGSINTSTLVYFKESGTGNTGWSINNPFAPNSKTTGELSTIANVINTTGKLTGRQVWNSTLGKPLWAGGTSANSPWVDATGATVITPS